MCLCELKSNIELRLEYIDYSSTAKKINELTMLVASSVVTVSNRYVSHI